MKILSLYYYKLMGKIKKLKEKISDGWQLYAK